jgi:mRNA interferase MazF
VAEVVGQIKRGDVVVIAIPGEYGKPRPAVVVQIDRLTSDFDSIVVCPITTDTSQHAVARIPIRPTASNGLRENSNVMVDKIVSMPRSKASRVIGHVDDDIMLRLEAALSIVLGLQ